MNQTQPEKKIDWNASKQDALEKIRQLPEYTNADILEQYQQLLDALDEPEIKKMIPKLKVHVLYERFPDFSLAYGALFHAACYRKTPLPVSEVEQILKIAQQKKNGNITEDKARGFIGDLAESRRRLRGSEQKD